ncbi:hypothetical protein DBB36_02350, partial [Flavobacterium sp. WLB]|uniref:hypothetical protein n=1 Tax=Flavobacterium sp. WLB TaxID=2161662 RepID=UPI000DE622A6
IKLEKPELIVFTPNWIKQKNDANSQSTFNNLSFDRVVFVKKQFEHLFEITFEITNNEELEWCFGIKENYNAMKGKKIKIKASPENPILVKPEKIKITVYPDKIIGILIHNEYDEIELFNSKLKFN